MKKLSKQQVKNFKKGAVALSLAAAMGLAGLSAFFTDSKTATNSFTVGKISQKLDEGEDWKKEEKEGKHDNITPGDKFKKAPTVENDGNNAQYVFMTVLVPTAEVTMTNADGSKGKTETTELFEYNINPGWKELGEAESTDKGVLHTYYYADGEALKALTAGTKTPALFNTVTFKNIAENETLNKRDIDIVVKSYGIQTTNLGDDTTPSKVWSLVQNQAK